MKPKLIRITTVPISLKILLQDQLLFMQQYFEVIAVSSSGNDLDYVGREQEVRTVAIEMSRAITPWKDLVSLVNMILLFRKEKPQIVHTHTPKAGLIGMMAAWLTGVPYRLHTIAGLPLMESTGLKRKVLLLVEKLTYFCATDLYPNSHGLEEFILESSLTSAKKVKVLGHGSSNGIDTEHFSITEEIVKKATVLKKEYGIGEEDLVFIFVGRIVKDKGINELLHAFNKLAQENDRVKLLLVGDFENTLDPISQDSNKILHTNSKIIQTGFQDDVRAFLAIADCLVFPSYREGFPNVVMQAGAMGLPSIVSDINGCNEIITDNINGIIIPPKDAKALLIAMQRVQESEELLDTLASCSRKNIVKKYDRAVFLQNLLDDYNKVLKK